MSLQSRHKEISFNYEKFSIKFITSDKTSAQDVNVNINTKTIKSNVKAVDTDSSLMDENELKTFIIKLLVEKLTGKKIKVLSLRDFQEKLHTLNSNIEKPEFAAEIEYEKLNYQKESVNFKANGKIITKDGRQIQFDITFSLNKEILDYTHLNIKAGSKALIDPLVINLNGNLENPLSDTKFSFDLDVDGNKENIPLLSAGYGFLVFDKNGNNIVDNGSELFGTKTGNGFGELKGYDDNKDGWITEDDKIFDKLKVWLKTPSKDSLISLKDLNIGAIYLNNVDTPLTLQEGFLKNSSIYIKENGKAGIISK
ncbi:hypothetical protein [Hydrogenivirga sp. 128-5-R1-1]|uniref:hypothetical protein n=1 Tax=Hydrogenivirga sp. 128-5-R1-1 TaxID=392423 RepID=UPI00015EF6AF|nr:hypothetical protein [Hydrogenivirga sp. 128-5-R1-1]EDP74424.1 hypothetical protein HG1285_12177 [Hydrogenivirga sp. 128-5-R1-1]